VVTVYENDNARPYAGGMHRGIDVAADAGTPVVAARPGTVTYAGALGAAGNVVALRTGPYAVSYLHLRDVSVARGEQVAAGARVGSVGTTGRRSVPEPHLHFGVRTGERRYVDPLSLLPGFPQEGAVPAGPVVRRERRPVRHPVAARAVAHVPMTVPDRGRPLVLGGAALLALLLGGGVRLRIRRRALRRAWRACPSRPGSLAPP
jgi:hypothetical protein